MLGKVLTRFGEKIQSPSWSVAPWNAFLARIAWLPGLPRHPETVYTDPLVFDDVRHAQPGGLSDQALGPCGVSGAC